MILPSEVPKATPAVHEDIVSGQKFRGLSANSSRSLSLPCLGAVGTALDVHALDFHKQIMAAAAGAGQDDSTMEVFDLVKARFEADACADPTAEVCEALESKALGFLIACLRPLRDRSKDSQVFETILREILDDSPKEEYKCGLSDLAKTFEKSYVARKMCRPTKTAPTTNSVRDATSFVVATEAIGNCQFVAIASALAMRQATEEAHRLIRERKPLVLRNGLREITGTSRGSKMASRALRALAVRWLSDLDKPSDVGTRGDLIDFMMVQNGDPSAPEPTAEEKDTLRRQYLHRMGHETVWGDHLTLIALANVCNAVIDVYRPDRDCPVPISKMPVQPKLRLVEQFKPLEQNDKTSLIRLVWDGRIVGQSESAHYMPMLFAGERWAIPIAHATSHYEIESVCERVGFVMVSDSAEDEPEKGKRVVIRGPWREAIESGLGFGVTTKGWEFLERMLAIIVSSMSYTTARFARHNRAFEARDVEAYQEGCEVRVEDVIQGSCLHAQVVEGEMRGGRTGYVLEESLLRALPLVTNDPVGTVARVLLSDGKDLSGGSKS